MEIKVFACSTYFLSLHLYLFYANDSGGSDRVVTAKNYGGHTIPESLPYMNPFTYSILQGTKSTYRKGHMLRKATAVNFLEEKQKVKPN